MIRLAVDFEFSSREWWENGGQDLWEAITEGFDENHAIVDDDLAASWLASAREIPGWAAGPEYAPNPITQARLNDDDPELGH